MELPVISLCPSYLAAYKSDVLKSFDWNAHLMRTMKIPETNMTTLEFWQLTTYKLQDMVDSVAILTTKRIPNTNAMKIEMFTDITGKKNESEFEIFFPFSKEDWTSVPTLFYGYCHTFKIPEKFAKLGIYSVRFKLKMESYIYVHHRKHFYVLEENKVTARIGHLHFVSLTIHKTNLMENSKGSNCSNELNYSHDDCIEEKLNKLMNQKFGCEFLTSKNPEKICNGRNGDVMAQMDFKDKFHQLMLEAKYSEMCPKPCETSGILFGIPVEEKYKRKDLSYVKLYFKQQIITRKSLPSYTMLSVIADVGGYLGLLLGFSLLDLSWVIKKIIFCIFWKIRQKQ